MAKWSEDVLPVLMRIERVAELIRGDATAGHRWNAERAGEIVNLARIAQSKAQETLSNGEDDGSL